MVKADVPVGVTDDGVNIAVVPEGRPETVRDVVWAVPLVNVAATVCIADSPWRMLMLDGEAESVKSKVSGVFTENVAEALALMSWYSADT